MHTTVQIYRWISWHFLPWELEGITSPCCLLIGQYLHHMTLCPPVAIVKRCYGIHLYSSHGHVLPAVSSVSPKEGYWGAAPTPFLVQYPIPLVWCWNWCGRVFPNHTIALSSTRMRSSPSSISGCRRTGSYMPTPASRSLTLNTPPGRAFDS